MIKLACLALSPLCAAMICAKMAPAPAPAAPAIVENGDHQFLAALEAQERQSVERTAQVDRALLAELQADASIPVAMAVPVAEPVYPRAVPVNRARVVSTPAPVRLATSPTATTLSLATPMSEFDMRPVRRAVPVVNSSRRASIVIFRGEVVVTPAMSASR